MRIHASYLCPPRWVIRQWTDTEHLARVILARQGAPLDRGQDDEPPDVLVAWLVFVFVLATALVVWQMLGV